ncbi:carboxypeptidase inhibitor SmCI-like [Dermacentor variabilis]|uniref:carboxypeptidase inhibitor SmCI-like n=1 Tax=Dermacentor variabilis TaxID=34621 RepID=UPI003F5BA366
MHLLTLGVRLWLGGISGIVILEKAEANHYCLLDPAVGVCRASLPRWFFNRTAKECQRFTFGGCHGNENNFMNEKECQRHCSGNVILEKPSAKDVCFLEEVVGRCRAAFPRWYFNQNTGSCEKFTYGGCHGNKNNFLTKEDCDEFCQEFLKDPCAQPIIPATKKSCTHEQKGRRFGYNKVTRKCESFEYSTCKENMNNFKSRKQCLLACAKNSFCLRQTKYHRSRRYVSYFYSARQDQCLQTTTYLHKKHTWPTDNRFRKREDCVAECMPEHTPHMRVQKL